MTQTDQWMPMRGWCTGAPFLAAYRNRFELSEKQTLDLTWSADERAVLFCDGQRIADGPHRGTPQTWFTMTTRLELDKGPHTLVFLLFAFGKALTAYAQTTLQPGIWVEPNPALNPDWELRLETRCIFTAAKTDWGSFAHILTDEEFNWEAVNGLGDGWKKAVRCEDHRKMVPSTLPAMRYEETFDFVRKGNYFLFPSYVKIYGEYEFSGTGMVRLRWAEPGAAPEALDENFIHGLKPGEPYPYFSGTGDQLLLTGKKIKFFDYWWHAGRTLEMTLFGDAKLESVRFFKTGYPWELKRGIAAPGDARLTRLLQKSWATLDACSGETFMDCPYYEQLQYISDSRFDMLSLYELTDDLRLTEKALRQFAEGLSKEGFLACRYPTKDFADYVPNYNEHCTLHIPSFTAFYAQMLHDFAKLRKNDALVQELLPVVRRSMAYLLKFRQENGLVRIPGWNFIDWRDDWDCGLPPGSEEGTGGTLNLIIHLSLQDWADLERHFGDAGKAAEAEKLAAELEDAVRQNYYDPKRALFLENETGYVCEHTQVFALLALKEKSVIPALEKHDLPECGIAFGFYYLEVCRAFRLDQLYRARLEKYLATADASERVTMPEVFPGGNWLRSDCHAWSAHALYHVFAQGTILDRIPVKP